VVRIFGNYINGKEVRSNSGKSFESINPTSEKILGKFQLSNSKDVQLAVASAKKGKEKWSKIPAPYRGQVLLEIANLLKKRKNQLAKLESMEMGKILSEAKGDVQEAIDVFEYMSGEGRRLFGHTTPSELPNKACYTIRKPVGVVGLITPWNFPIAIPSWKVAPALICGDGIVLKPSSDTPLCALEFVKLCEEAGIPKGVINLVTGSGQEVGGNLVRNNEINGISFTGSRETGEFITKNAGLKKVGLELGGKNPIIIMDDADLDLAIDGVLFGAFGTTGQRCTAASRLILHKKISKKFENMLVSKAKKLRVGDPLKESTQVGPLVNKKAVEKTEKYSQIARKEGAKVLCGGIKSGKGFFYNPTVFTNVKSRMRVAQEEIFGPAVSLITVKNFEEAINVANDVKYGLSSSIYTSNVNLAHKAIDLLEAGIVYVNSPTIGAEVHLPFGGIKGTGNGTREAGIEGIHEFSETQTVYIDYSGKLQKAQRIK
jgi:aldehyde dehydrogenase (NAD+)